MARDYLFIVQNKVSYKQITPSHVNEWHSLYFILDYKQITPTMWAGDTVSFILNYKQIIPSHVSEWHSLFYSGL
jgi:hypothetical protein